MPIQQIILSILWVIGSFLIALFLKNKYVFFKQLIGILSLLACFILFVFLHNGFYALFQAEEGVFFVLSLFVLGSSVFLFLFWIIEKITVITKK